MIADKAGPESGKSLGPIACVTVTAPDLTRVEAGYTEFLDYEVVGRGRVAAELADLWGCAGAAHSRYLLLSPAAGDECVLRFVEAPAVPNFTPFSTHGWNAAEILVQDVDALAPRLADSPFEIVGEPANLSFTDDIRAMQVIGPGSELLYLTELKKAIPGMDLPMARCSVDNVFIVILGGPAMGDLQAYYANQFGVPQAAAMESRVKGMSAAFGRSPETRYPIAALPLAGQNMLEVDEMPAEARPRQSATGLLPPGIAMVSFSARGLDEGDSRPCDHDEVPYRDAARVACHRGAAGEIIEVLQRD